MSIGIVVRCDRSGQYGTCARALHTGTSTHDDAYAAAARAGWDVGRGTDLCPAHAPRRTPSAGPRCGNNPNTRLSPGDAKAVADFKAYLDRRAAGELPSRHL